MLLGAAEAAEYKSDLMRSATDSSS